MTAFDTDPRAMMGDTAYATVAELAATLPEPRSDTVVKLLEHGRGHGELEVALRLGALAECIEDLRARVNALETRQ